MLKPTLMAAVPVRTARSFISSTQDVLSAAGDGVIKLIVILLIFFSPDRIYL